MSILTDGQRVWLRVARTDIRAEKRIWADYSNRCKVFSLLVGMGVVCSLSVWGNIELWKSKRQYADDALKFRVIRSWGGCNAKTILWLNDVFDIRRDEETIEWLRQEADGYDRDLKAVSDSLMQDKIRQQGE